MRRLAVLFTAVSMVGASMLVAPALPASAQEPESTSQEATPEVAPDRVNDPDRILGADWSTASDRAAVTSGDAMGLHVLAADRSDAYQWRTVATLTEPLLESDQWIGQMCVNGAGDRALVVYAPRTFTNYPLLMEGGAFAAVVDLDSGEVTKLNQRVTLAYYNPACGVGDSAVLSRFEQASETVETTRTWVGTVDLRNATVADERYADGQLTSAVPIDGRIVAAKGYSLVEVTPTGAARLIAPTDGAPLRLMPDGDTGLAFQVAGHDDVDLAQWDGLNVEVVDTAPLGAVKLRPGAGGHVHVVGARATDLLRADLPDGWRINDALPDSYPSTEGSLLVTRVGTGMEAAGRLVAEPDDGDPQRVRIEALMPNQAAEPLRFAVQPAVGVPGSLPSPTLGGSPEPDIGPTPETGGAGTANHHGTVPWDPDRACSVPRNDPEQQVYQPGAEEVEWAVNLAVRNELTFNRPANWLNSGLPSYSPQQMFPSMSLAGGGTVPTQIMLAIVAQESNLYQASWRVVDGLGGNPLVPSGFYGLHWNNPDASLIDFEGQWVDCGYGVAQVTTGMHSSDTGTSVNGIVMDYTKQRAVAQDYAVNVAAGLRILQEKWNETYNANVRANNGDPQYLENWWFAVWAYNSGLQPDYRFGNETGCTPGPSCTDPNGYWGLGWSNNSASPMYPEDRKMFLTAPLDHPDVDPPDEVGYDNARHPNHWSYPERVMGFAYESLRRWDYQTQLYVPTYLAAVRSEQTEQAQPHRLTFCAISVNGCDPNNEAYQPDPGQFPDYPDTHCMRGDLRCWWNQSVSWGAANCGDCGTERRRFTAGSPQPSLATPIHSAACSPTGLPAEALVVNSLDSADPLGRHGCPRTWGDHGSFEMEFGSTTGPQGDPVYPSKVDLHQINGGFGGHFWVSHVHSAFSPWMSIEGTWRLNQTVDGPVRVWVHLPDHGARTLSAKYIVIHRDGQTTVDIPQHGSGNRWQELGEFMFDGQPEVVLSNMDLDVDGSVSIAFDAVAFEPLPVPCVGLLCDGIDPGTVNCPATGYGPLLYDSNHYHFDGPINLNYQQRLSVLCEARWARMWIDDWCPGSPPCTSWPAVQLRIERRVEGGGGGWTTTHESLITVPYGETGMHWTNMVPDVRPAETRVCFRGYGGTLPGWQHGNAPWSCGGWIP